LKDFPSTEKVKEVEIINQITDKYFHITLPMFFNLINGVPKKLSLIADKSLLYEDLSAISYLLGRTINNFFDLNPKEF